MLSKYSDFVLRWRFFVVLISLVCAFALAAGGKNLVFTNDYRYFFSEDNPQLLEFETLQDTYTKQDNVFVMLEPKNGDVFNKEFLAALKELTENSWQVPYSIRVDSITNFQHTYAEEDDLIVIDLVDDIENLDEKNLSYIKHVALSEPLLVHRLVSATSEAAAVNITIELPGVNEITEGPEVVSYARDMVEEFEQSHPDINVYSTGIVMMNNAFPEASINDMKSLIPFAFAAIIIGLFIFLRSISTTISSLVVIILSIMMGMGAAGWMGFKLTPPSASAPTMILTLAVADCVHFLTTFLHSMRNGSEKFAAIKESMRINFNPIFLTSLTTAIGFLSLNFSDVPPFRDLGNITAMGVMFAFVLSIFFLPALIAILPVKVKPGVDKKTRLMQNIAGFVISKRKTLLWSMGLVIFAFIAIIPRNEINDRFVEYFDESIEFRQHTDYVTEKISGLYSVQFSLEANSSGGISEPEFLQKMDDFTYWLRNQPEVMHVNTVSDTFKRLNKNMHGDDENFYKLPNNRELAAQYLLLYELSLPYGLDLNDQINIDKSSTRLSATLENLSTDQMLNFEQRSRDWIKDNAFDISMVASSPAVIFSHLAVRNIDSMIVGTLIALAIISVILIFALKSLRLGLISLIPNLTPVGVAFGVWAIFDSEIGLALSIVAGMTLGIVVDDTVHFMSKYLRAKREKSLTAINAVRYAFENVGSALLVTTVVLAAGFLVLSMSAFELNSAMGLLTAITIVIALIIDFLFLPPLLIALEGGGKEQENQDEEELDSDLATAS
ncbi:MAG: efflux RND transporter permease subunit [Gammaproteobacteria bacterium]